MPNAVSQLSASALSQFIQRAHALGMTLNDLRVLVYLAANGNKAHVSDIVANLTMDRQAVMRVAQQRLQVFALTDLPALAVKTRPARVGIKLTRQGAALVRKIAVEH